MSVTQSSDDEAAGWVSISDQEPETKKMIEVRGTCWLSEQGEWVELQNRVTHWRQLPLSIEES